ncbi:UDP-2,3-diacylglucosamine hydrolase [Singulisphaera sp. GP187]|uniref:UDP-2,3-diacylglucosamine diphosphatase n=1 Tax=Singulisphaera sp. GP187 TaxID=1882752 RepID=UPI000929F196|nr:UDP-2,3-diacylglucosamine diphosphatase [Singulisphaera sp. GP187]SIO60824.1 UDP-2,3-diacylglucosamine hydrolase [Singulisphaera sp. GP187]
MSSYFTSDVHLRLDRPERGRRFACWVESLGKDDSLTIVGDLCDFWFAARQYQTGANSCPGLRALADFRARGGQLTIMAGNHDGWLGPFYEKELGARFAPEPLEIETHGVRLILRHGHNVGGQRVWKRGMESRSFLNAFRNLPGTLASFLDHQLNRRNQRKREGDDTRQFTAYRRYVESCVGRADVVIMGHIHRSFEDATSTPRLIIPGGWFGQSSFVKVDASGASLIVEKTPASTTC